MEDAPLGGEENKGLKPLVQQTSLFEDHFCSSIAVHGKRDFSIGYYDSQMVSWLMTS
jgi:hypothetical protein